MTSNISISTFRSACIFALLAGLLIFCASCRNQSPKVEEEIDARTPVTVIPVIHKTISETFEFPAVSVFIRKNTIRATTTGNVETVSITPGDLVTKGQPLFSIKTLEASAIQRTFKGDTSLVISGLINVTSPEDGVVTSITHQTGDFVQGGDELAVISDQKSLVFSLETPFELRSYFRQGMVCTLRLPDSTLIKGVVTGKMSEMNIQAQTLSFLVKPLSAERFPQNLMVFAVINKQTRTNVQVLPRTAVLGNETQTEFWVMKVLNDSVAVKVSVRKGIENIDEVEITDPKFLPEDKILVTGNYGLPDTASIVIIQ